MRGEVRTLALAWEGHVLPAVDVGDGRLPPRLLRLPGRVETKAILPGASFLVF